MTEMQAAIGLVQLQKLERRIGLRRRNAQILAAELCNVPGAIVDQPPPRCRHVYYKFYARLDEKIYDLPSVRDVICGEICQRGPLAGSGSCPEIYREQAFRSAGIGPPTRLRRARQIGESTLMLQCDHTLEPEQVRQIGQITTRVIEAQGSKRAAA
jgi:dTDP-4-amino-4,6-dideoxygalactose transaminase